MTWPWQSSCKEKNDFFQYSTPECLALGGCGHFAIHVDQELLQVRATRERRGARPAAPGWASGCGVVRAAPTVRTSWRLQGSSGVCGTFGSPCLATREDFKVVCLEVWQAGS